MATGSRPRDPFAALPPAPGLVRPATLSPWHRPAAAERPATLPASVIKPSPLPHAFAKPGLSALEIKHPGIAQAVTLMWGHPEMNAYFERVYLADTPRTPIDPEAMAELMLLSRIHQALRPQRPATLNQSIYGSQYKDSRPSDVWDQATPARRR